MPKVVNPPAKESLLPFLCLAVMVLIAELMVAYMFYLSHNLLLAITMHLGVMWILLFFVYYAYGRSEAKLAIFLLVASAATGPFGAAICFLASIVYVVSPRNNLSPVEWINTFLGDAETTEHEFLHERLDLGLENIPDDSNVEPFYDILSSGTVSQKQIAIARMMRYFRPQFAPLLLRAVQDSNAVVRVQAATAMAKIEHDFMAKYLSLKRTLRDIPENASARLDFARICDIYAHAGLLDDASIKGLRAQAIEIYKKELEHCNEPNLKLQLARLYLRDNQPEQTCELLYDSIKVKEATPAMVFWYMEALFRLKKFTQLRLLINRYADILKNFSGYKSQAETLGLLSVWSANNINIEDRETYAA